MLASLTINNSVLYSYNVKSKMFLSVVCSIVAIFLTTLEPLLLMFCFSFCYALLMKRYRVLVVSYFFMLLMMFISLGCVHLVGIYVPAMKESAQLSKLALPFLRGACVMNVVIPLTLTIRMQNLLTTLQTLHLPFIIYLPGAVMIRFVPTFINDVKQVFEAMKIRGFEFTLKNIFSHPLLLIRLSFTPLVFMSLRSSEDLGIASELKGIGMRNHCNFKNQSLHTKDYYLMLLSLFICIFSLYLEHVSGGNFISMKGGHP